MLKRDKIKVVVIAILLVILGIMFFIFGKDSPIMKYTSAFCLIAWLATMFIVNKKYR
ncbi:MAG: hypothetical protein KDD41_11820 [Flavobacteriales bacterium]|nr:hypothetical protein [Flavobacteriales bacterium]